MEPQSLPGATSPETQSPAQAGTRGNEGQRGGQESADTQPPRTPGTSNSGLRKPNLKLNGLLMHRELGCSCTSEFSAASSRRSFKPRLQGPTLGVAPVAISPLLATARTEFPRLQSQTGPKLTRHSSPTPSRRGAAQQPEGEPNWGPQGEPNWVNQRVVSPHNVPLARMALALSWPKPRKPQHHFSANEMVLTSS